MAELAVNTGDNGALRRNSGCRDTWLNESCGPLPLRCRGGHPCKGSKFLSIWSATLAPAFASLAATLSPLVVDAESSLVP